MIATSGLRCLSGSPESQQREELQAMLSAILTGRSARPVVGPGATRPRPGTDATLRSAAIIAQPVQARREYNAVTRENGPLSHAGQRQAWVSHRSRRFCHRGNSAPQVRYPRLCRGYLTLLPKQRLPSVPTEHTLCDGLITGCPWMTTVSDGVQAVKIHGVAS